MLKTAQSYAVLEGADGFRLGEGQVGALLVHGYTGSPQGMRGLGEYLAERGLAVAAPRLPGHGTSWEDLAGRTYYEWLGAVESAREELASKTDEVFVIALSFGAALCFDVIARDPSGVAGLVTIAGFVKTWDPRRFAAGLIRRVAKTLPGAGNDIADSTFREIVYDKLPTTATYSMLQMLKRARATLSKIECPILVMHSHNDHTVDFRNAELIYNSVASSDKELLWFDRSYHVLTLDYDREEVFDKAFEFIRKRSAHEL